MARPSATVIMVDVVIVVVAIACVVLLPRILYLLTRLYTMLCKPWTKANLTRRGRITSHESRVPAQGQTQS
jgi:hypothetical protein